MNFLQRNPWILLVILFIGFLLAWAVWLTLASRYAPERVPLENVPHAARH